MRVKCLFAALLGLLIALPAGAAVQITSLSPDSASPGTKITVTGGPFSSGVTVLVGEAQVQPATLDDRRLTFFLPELPPGQYVLRLDEAGEVSLRPLLFRVVAPQPQIQAITPGEYDQCLTDSPPQITVSGKGFAASANLLIDGVAVPLESLSTDHLLLTPPPLAPGPHQIVVANPSGDRSLPSGLLVNGTPEISSITIGDNDVTSYQLIIDGKNFLASSQLLVDGKRIPMNRYSPPEQENATVDDCRTIVYHRHPVSSQSQQIAFQVLNPGGMQSKVMYLQAP